MATIAARRSASALAVRHRGRPLPCPYHPLALAIFVRVPPEAPRYLRPGCCGEHGRFNGYAICDAVFRLSGSTNAALD
jgi:hypothetical protein